jgi:hypothetical protein
VVRIGGSHRVWREKVNELINRDKAGLDIFSLRDERREEFDNRDVIAQEIVAAEATPRTVRESDADLVREGIKNQEGRKA